MRVLASAVPYAFQEIIRQLADFAREPARAVNREIPDAGGCAGGRHGRKRDYLPAIIGVRSRRQIVFEIIGAGRGEEHVRFHEADQFTDVMLRFADSDDVDVPEMDEHFDPFFLRHDWTVRPLPQFGEFVGINADNQNVSV